MTKVMLVASLLASGALLPAGVSAAESKASAQATTGAAAPSQPATSQPQGSPPPPPSAVPPTPPAAQPLEPATAPAPVAAPAPPPGQWVYTAQYGWVWMPYDVAYTYVAPDVHVAYIYVFYPAFGWRWVVAPWVIGLGPAPHWGPLGTARFVWLGRFRPVHAVPFRGHGWHAFHGHWRR